MQTTLRRDPLVFVITLALLLWLTPAPSVQAWSTTSFTYDAPHDLGHLGLVRGGFLGCNNLDGTIAVNFPTVYPTRAWPVYGSWNTPVYHHGSTSGVVGGFTTSTTAFNIPQAVQRMPAKVWYRIYRNTGSGFFTYFTGSKVFSMPMLQGIDGSSLIGPLAHAVPTGRYRVAFWIQWYDGSGYNGSGSWVRFWFNQSSDYAYWAGWTGWVGSSTNWCERN